MVEKDIRNLKSYSPQVAAKQTLLHKTWSNDFKVPTTETWSFWADYKKPYSNNRKHKIFFSSLQLSLYYGQIKITSPILRMEKMFIIHLLKKKVDGKNETCLQFLISEAGGPLN